MTKKSPPINDQQTSSKKQSLMPFWEHVEELRKRLLIALVALVITTLISFTYAEQIIEIIAQPVGGIESLQSIEVTETVGVFARVSLISGVVLAMPVILYEILAFMMPGLKKNERKWVLFGVLFGTLFFIVGVYFAYKVMLPATLDFLLSFMGIETIPRISSYIKFITNLIFWIGVAFQLPLIIFVLAKFGVVTPGMLLKYWRYAVIIIAVFAAVITPTIDPVNMALLMAPLILLYFVSILFAVIARGKKKEPEEQPQP